MTGQTIALGAPIHWPRDFGTRFTLFVDAEEEFDWSRPFDRGARATTAMAALPAFHARLADRGVGVTYMVDHPIATDPRSIAILKTLLDDRRSAIGTQLHPWVNPPYEEPDDRRASFAGNLSSALEAAKLDCLGAAIGTAFGTPPLAYRAGRYGIGPATLRLLRARGYRLDTSMRALFDYSGEGGPDFSAIGPHAHRVGPDDAIVELPPTTIFTGWARRRADVLFGPAGRIPRARGVLARTRALSRVPLSPEGVPVDEALEAVRVAIGEGVRVLNLGFHTPSLVPGNTPYVRDAAHLAVFDRWWDRVLDLLDRRGVRPATLTELLAAAA